MKAEQQKGLSATSRRPTRSDVSEVAGVAPSTVSLVLNGRGDGLGIPKDTQQRVRDAANALGYVPNKLIRAVRKGQTHIIGLYLRWEQWSMPLGYWQELKWRVLQAVSETPYQVMMHTAKMGVSTEETFAEQAGGLLDGVLLFNSGSDQIVPRLISARIPAVEVGDTFSELPCVGSDGAHGVRLALEHLVERGYRRPAYLSHDSSYEADQQSRVQAFLEHGEAMFGRPLGGNTAAVLADDVPTIAMKQLAERPDCVICASDELAHCLVGECARQGMRVPEDLAIIGFDALTTLHRFPVLTSIATPLEDVARLAVAKLLAILEGEEVEQTTVLRPGLRIGATT